MPRCPKARCAGLRQGLALGSPVVVVASWVGVEGRGKTNSSMYMRECKCVASKGGPNEISTADRESAPNWRQTQAIQMHMICMLHGAPAVCGAVFELRPSPMWAKMHAVERVRWGECAVRERERILHSKPSGGVAVDHVRTLPVCVQSTTLSPPSTHHPPPRHTLAVPLT